MLKVIHAKWEDLERLQQSRLRPNTQSLTDPSTQSFQWSRLPSQITAARNRYPIAEPFALHRVRLRISNDANDYINASPIQLGTKRYIAAQGPKSTTVNHFYRMLAAEARSPAIVVMLTRTHENGSEKCFPYFPASEFESPLAIPVDEEFHDGFQGSVILKDLVNDSSTQSQIRRLCLRASWDSVTFRELEIVHLLFETWPDHSAPDGQSQEALVRLIKSSASWNSMRLSGGSLSEGVGGRTAPSREWDDFEAPQNPVIVHCSAGCGRTGTFIALDYLLSLLDAGKLDDIPPDKDPVAEIVGDLRRQRMAMVQKEQQFRFIYDVLREQMKARQQQRQA